MTRFKAIFTTVLNPVDSSMDRDVEPSWGLSAESLDGAETEALALPRSPEINLLKILDEGRVVRRSWINPDA